MKRTTKWWGPAGIGMALVAALWAAPLMANGSEPREVRWLQPVKADRIGKFISEPGIPAELMTEGFLAGHPDIRWRREGLRVYGNGNQAEAMSYFQRAARHADKPAQAIIAEMYWNGTGVEQDRALGYAWMDLAAERQYPNFLILREYYWSQLDAAARDDAIRRGQQVYAEYGDEVAWPRLERAMKREAHSTYSRPGRAHHGIKIVPLTGPLAASSVELSGMVSPRRGVALGGVRHVNAITVSGERYYAKTYWDPVEYRNLLDIVWKNPPTPQVDVGPLQQDEERDAN